MDPWMKKVDGVATIDGDKDGLSEEMVKNGIQLLLRLWEERHTSNRNQWNFRGQRR